MTSCDRPGANASLASWHWTLCRQGTTQSRVAVCDEDGGHPGMGAAARSEGFPRVRLTSLEMLAPAVDTAIVGAILGSPSSLRVPAHGDDGAGSAADTGVWSYPHARVSPRIVGHRSVLAREERFAESVHSLDLCGFGAGLSRRRLQRRCEVRPAMPPGRSPDTLTACLQSGSALGRRARVQESCSGRTRRHSTDRCRGTSRRCLRRAS